MKKVETERKRVTWPGDAADEPVKRHEREKAEEAKRRGEQPAPEPKGE